MEHKPVASSNIESIGYENGTMEVKFRNGGLYRYKNVPGDVHERMVAAPSAGKFLGKEIRGKFDFSKVK